MFDLFYQVTGPHVDFNSKEKALLESVFTYRQVPRRFPLLREGEVAREMYFINRGLIRMYYNKDGEEITGFIFQEGLFAGSHGSMITQTPSLQILETLEDSDLLVLKFSDLEMLYERLPKMNILTRKVVEQRFLNAQRILSSFILDSPETRYLKFEARHGDLLQRVPQHVIASCLGITPVSLSRIRKRIADADDK